MLRPEARASSTGRGGSGTTSAHPCPAAAAGRRAVQAAQARRVACAAAPQELGYWDVVEYACERRGLRLGLVQEVQPDGSVSLTPLVEEELDVWVPEDGDDSGGSGARTQRVPGDRVVRLIDHAYGQRQDKEHNPHGEHAHDAWQVLVPLPPEVFRGDLRRG